LGRPKTTRKKYFLLLCLLIITLTSCLKSDPEKQPVPTDPVKQAAIDEAAIKAYLAIHTEIIATKDTVSGLYYQIVTPGTGFNPSGGSTVTVAYTGKLLNDIPFDTSTSYTLALKDQMPGWIIGVPLIKPGGRIILLIPSRLGYGDQPYGQIPANSVLVFTIDLISIN